MSKPAKYVVPLPGAVSDEPRWVWLTDKIEVVVFRDPSGRLRVLSSICPHMGARLCPDEPRTHLRCPWHGLAFDLATMTSDHHRYKTLHEWDAALEDDRLVVYE